MQYLESLGDVPVLHKQGEGESPVYESRCSEGECVVATPHTTHPSPPTPCSFLLSPCLIIHITHHSPHSSLSYLTQQLSTAQYTTQSHLTQPTYSLSLTLTLTPHSAATPPNYPSHHQFHPNPNSPHLYPHIAYLFSPLLFTPRSHLIITHHSSSHFTHQLTLPSLHYPHSPLI